MIEPACCSHDHLPVFITFVFIHFEIIFVFVFCLFVFFLYHIIFCYILCSVDYDVATTDPADIP